MAKKVTHQPDSSINLLNWWTKISFTCWLMGCLTGFLLFICFLILIHSSQRSIPAQDTAGVKKVMVDKLLQAVWRKPCRLEQALAGNFSKPWQALWTSPCRHFEQALAGNFNEPLQAVWTSACRRLNKPWWASP